MSLTPGTRLGPFEIVAPLGAGGMGEVYRAKDTRLGRDVAVKVLPQHLSANPEIRARFEREAKTVSSLNHPHICTLHDVGREGETDYLVMELIEGETLAARLAKGPLPLADVLKYGGQIADALDRAHREGVMHRDLKPGNVMLTKTGAKLMDFGLARATGLGAVSVMTSSPTVVGPLTAEGTIIGTFQYMAPEQLEGQEADTRADLWALGCVLYEMATGKRAFEGKSQASLITAIMGSEPAPISQVSPLAPPALASLVGGCLAKDPADRIQSAHDVKLQLSWIAAGGSQTGAQATVAARLRTRGRLAWVGVGAVIAALILGAAAGYLGRGRSTATSTGASDVSYKPVTFEEGFVFAARFASDGRTIVYSADWDRQQRDVFVTSLDSREFRPLGFPGADLLGISRSGELAILNASTVTGGSPYHRRGTLARASLTGGSPRLEVEGVRFADFGADRAMAVVREEADKLTMEYPVGHVLAEGPAGFYAPRVSPSGEYVAFFESLTVNGVLAVKIFDRSGKFVTQSREFGDWWGLAWTPANELWFAATEVGGQQTVVFGLDLHGRHRAVYVAPGAFTLHDVSTQGDMLASFDHPLNRIELIDVADAAPQDRTWRDGGRLAGFSPSRHLLLQFSAGSGSGGPSGSAYVWQPGAPQPVRIAEGSAVGLSPDGSKALVVPYKLPLTVSIVPTGAGQPQPLDLGSIESVAWAGWLPDGRIVISFARQGGKPVAHVLSLDGRNPVPLLPEGATLEGANLISPDGSRIAATDADGRLAVCTITPTACRPVPGATDREAAAGWTADGTSLFVYHGQVVPTQVDRLDVASGARSAWKTVRPLQAAVTGLRTIMASPDGALVYGYSRTRSELYVMKGLN
jgi:hypothetical protein